MTRTWMTALIVLGSATLGLGSAAFGGVTQDAVRARGVLNCGTSTGSTVGLSTLDDAGNWQGMDVDLCRAVAAAVLGDARKIDFIPLEFKNAFAALQSGKVDMLARAASYTFTRDTELGLDVAGIYMYDGQGFLVRKSLGVTSALALDGASICVTSGTTTELNLADYFRSNAMSYTPIVAKGRAEHQANLEAGRCDAYTNERGGLAASRTALSEPSAFEILPEVISKEPLALYVRQDDAQWKDVVGWTFNALIIAEEFGLTQANVGTQARDAKHPEVQRLLGMSGDFGAKIGLPDDWAVRAIAAVGNYGEMFSRNVGATSVVALDRGLNRLWRDGGLIYAPPFR